MVCIACIFLWLASTLWWWDSSVSSVCSCSSFIFIARWYSRKEYTAIYLFSLLLMYLWVISSFKPLWMILLGSFLYIYMSFIACRSIGLSGGCVPRSWIAGCILSTWILMPNNFLKWLNQSILFLAVCESPCCSTSLLTLDVVSVLNFSYSGGYIVVSHWGWLCISLTIFSTGVSVFFLLPCGSSLFWIWALTWLYMWQITHILLLCV